MAITLYFLSGFNNYYNRQVKMPEEQNPSAYNNYIVKIDEVSKFNPNDGVMAELEVDYWDDTYDIRDDIDLDYLLVCEDTPTVITSKWFILDRHRKARQKWVITIRRDLIADNYQSVINAPCFIEKATLNADSPLLWNKENMTFNQIKQEEILLKDGSGCPWIVGYYSKNTPAENLQGTVDANDLDKAYDEVINVPFSNWQYNATATPFTGLFSELDYRIYTRNITFTTSGYIRFNKAGEFTGVIQDSTTFSLSANNHGAEAAAELEPTFQSRVAALNALVPDYVENTKTEATIAKFLSYNGLTIKDSEGKYYSLSIYTEEDEEEVVNIPSGSLFNGINSIVQESTIITGTANTFSYKVSYKRPKYRMVATELTNLETTWDMSGAKFITDDAPYNIFAIPYGNTQLELSGYAVATSNEAIGMAVANSIIRTMADNLYDIQLLPYCPVNTPMVTSPTGIGLLQVYDTEAFSRVSTPGGETLDHYVSYILNVPKAKFTRNLSYPIAAPTDAIEKKVSNECEMYRLCSPNYNGAFEFSVAKNDGVDYFNVDCEYKPFTPYIHINPNFKGMYGRDFDDARGLICNGDFSLTQIKDAWQSYKIQNKNYQEIFARQIENMEVNNNIQRNQEIWSAIAGGITGTATGAGAGAAIGGLAGAAAGPVGAGIGAGVGAAASIAGGIADIYYSDLLRAEALDYTKDQFGYNLGNIQALPYTLTKVSAYNNNNKVFPFVERYSATEVEKEALRNKIKYDGMTTMVIGSIIDYQQAEPSYIKGRIIRIENNEQLDYHSLTELANEIYKGVFI